jgi:hypothetical protein
LMRCASPPLSSVAGWPSRRYPSPSRSVSRLREAAGTSERNLAASSTVVARTRELVLASAELFDGVGGEDDVWVAKATSETCQGADPDDEERPTADWLGKVDRRIVAGKPLDDIKADLDKLETEDDLFAYVDTRPRSVWDAPEYWRLLTAAPAAGARVYR